MDYQDRPCVGISKDGFQKSGAPLAGTASDEVRD
jgi:hypothetical protein